MMPLSLDQSPPYSVPLRFFVTAPLFGAAAGVALALGGPTVTASRWSVEALIATHLLTLGFMFQVMAGALLQFMPVAVGANVWRVRWVSGVVHVTAAAGTLALVAGFDGHRWAWPWAIVLLGTAISALAAAVGAALWRSKALGPTLPALRSAVGALVVTGGLGIALAGTLGLGWPLPPVELTHLHLAFGVFGWALTLLAGVGYLVVPMFQLTQGYPTRFAFGLPRAIAGGLVAWTAGVLLERFFNRDAGVTVAFSGWLVLGGAAAAFAVQTLWLQAGRRRAVVDTTLRFWRTGLSCLLVALAVAIAIAAVPPGLERGRLEYLFGVLLLGGALPALITGMLYKIAGFLTWLHLQAKVQSPPMMHQVVPERRTRAQRAVFCAALVLLALGAVWPALTAAGGALFALAFVLLELNLLAVLRTYARASRVNSAGNSQVRIATSARL